MVNANIVDLKEFRAYRVEKDAHKVRRAVTTMSIDELPPGEVVVKVHYSSLNYKDALSASGYPGVTKSYPHTPGIDAAGEVLASSDARFAGGDAVIVTSYDLGMNTPGGFGQVIRVPAEWVVPLPEALSLRESMILGTAGLTAALAVDELLRHDLASPALVTGASGGLGSLTVAILAKLGLEVTASTGKESAHEMLRELGATSFLDRQELAEATERPLLKARWGGAVDTVGGRTLENVVKSLKWGAAVAACGNVGGAEVSLTVFPFILRGVKLLGVDSAGCPMERRQAAWRKLAGEWKPMEMDKITSEIGLDELDEAVEAILKGEVQGRVLVNLNR
jgi:acrylyl-CoA reductase (NADPH)